MCEGEKEMVAAIEGAACYLLGAQRKWAAEAVDLAAADPHAVHPPVRRVAMLLDPGLCVKKDEKGEKQ